MLKVTNLQIPNSKCLDFNLKPSEFIILVGTSGSGKTLFLKALAGLLPCTFDEFSYHGQAYGNLDWPKIRSEILYLQQKPVKVPGTVEDIIRAPFRYQVNSKKIFDETKLELYLRRLGLQKDFLTKNSIHLSGGEEQMVAILRTLLLDPQILLLDEPTAAIDRTRTIEVENLIIEWKNNSAKKPAIVFVTHDEAQEKRLPGEICGINQFVCKNPVIYTNPLN